MDSGVRRPRHYRAGSSHAVLCRFERRGLLDSVVGKLRIDIGTLLEPVCTIHLELLLLVAFFPLGNCLVRGENLFDLALLGRTYGLDIRRLVSLKLVFYDFLAQLACLELRLKLRGLRSLDGDSLRLDLNRLLRLLLLWLAADRLVVFVFVNKLLEALLATLLTLLNLHFVFSLHQVVLRQEHS